MGLGRSFVIARPYVSQGGGESTDRTRCQASVDEGPSPRQLWRVFSLSVGGVVIRVFGEGGLNRHPQGRQLTQSMGGGHRPSVGARSWAAQIV